MNHTFLIISRSQNRFNVTQAEVDPHTPQGATELKDKINQVAVQETVTQVIDCGEQKAAN